MSETKALARIDPQALLQRAVEGNASIETLERLVALAKDVREVQAREGWNEAMATFQRRCPPIKKTSKAKIETARGSYSYSYAPLDLIVETIRPLLGELGMSISWVSRVEPSRVVVSCRVAHILGYSESSGEISMPIPDASERGGGNPSQRVGSALTYARRYSLLQVTGLAPEDDDDATGSGIPAATQTPTPATQHPDDPPAEPASTTQPKGIVFPFGKHKDESPFFLPLDDLKKELVFWTKKTETEKNDRFKANNQRLVDAITDAIASKEAPVPSFALTPDAVLPPEETAPSERDQAWVACQDLAAEKGWSEAKIMLHCHKAYSKGVQELTLMELQALRMAIASA